MSQDSPNINDTKGSGSRRSGPHHSGQRNSGPWSITLLTIRDIPIRVHMSFFFLIAYVAFIEAGGTSVSRVVFVLTLFACVLLHELGHALTAKLFGISTRDITLYPFGGIASLLGEGKPRDEFFIAIAGPLVNLVIAAACAPFMDLNFGSNLEGLPGFITRIFIANISLAFFNLIPALPMDGGRILRASLALMGVRRATTVAARVSQVLCVIMGTFAVLTGNVILTIISVLVFTNAVQEHLRARTKVSAVGFKVKDVMTDAAILQTFTHGMTVSQALKIALKSLQSIFPVVHGGSIIGVITREALLETGALDADDSYVSGHMNREFGTVGPEDEVSRALEIMQTKGEESLMVLQDGNLVGLLLRDKVLEYLLVQEFRKKAIAEAEYLKREEF